MTGVSPGGGLVDKVGWKPHAQFLGHGMVEHELLNGDFLDG